MKKTKNEIPTKDGIPIVEAIHVDRQGIIESCPFCSRKHFHGVLDPDKHELHHRVAHCPGNDDCPTGGYFLRFKK